MFSQPDIKSPTITNPTEYAAAKMPDAGSTATAGNATKNRMRSAASTVLTSGSGVQTGAATMGKTLLGQ